MDEIEDNSVDTIITSCPYWGLRDYGTEANQIWGGDLECKHQWGKSIPRKYHKAGETNPGKEGYTKDAGAWGQTSGQFCQLCSAWFGQLGLEPTLEMYIDHLLFITAECKRVLKPTGVMWWNHGDNYNSKRSAPNAPKLGKREREYNQVSITSDNIPPKCLCLQNYRLILKMIDEQGWILRNTVIWNKPNNMPSSTKDRLTNKYEPVFFLVKNIKARYYWNEKTGLMTSKKPSKDKQVEGVDWDWQEVGMVDDNVFNVRVRDADKGRFMESATEEEKRDYGKGKLKKKSYWHSLDYWFDLDAIREEPKFKEVWSRKGAKEGTPYEQNNPRKRWGLTKHEIATKRTSGSYSDPLHTKPYDIKGKNPADVWSIPTQPYPEAHFATFPEKLIIKPILSSCPESICRKCEKARVRITSKSYTTSPGQPPPFTKQQGQKFQGKIKGEKKFATRYEVEYQTIGWTDCGCNAGWHPGIILDPFAGSGTTLAMAKRHGRQFIGYEIVKSYIPLIRKRLEKEDTMFNRELKETFI